MISAKHQRFIELVAAGETQESAYLKAVSGKVGGRYKASKATAQQKGSGLAARYAQDIAKIKELRQRAVEQANQSDAAKDALKGILTSSQRMQFLSGIINAKTDVKTIGRQAVSLIVHDDGRKEIINLSDKLKALAELNEMTGDHAARKTDITSGGKSLKNVIIS